MTTRKDIENAVNAVTKKLIDEGFLIEAGFAAYIVTVWGMDAPEKMPPDQMAALRKCFFSGAQHLFGTINNVLDDDAEPTENDMRRMDQISTELNSWYATMVRDHMKTKGSA